MCEKDTLGNNTSDVIMKWMILAGKWHIREGFIQVSLYVVCILDCLCVVQLSSCWAIIMEHMISKGATNMVNFIANKNANEMYISVPT